ncbi:MAG TPA: dockerin type I domain-containing protein [Candidatus Paceibacterota bacterium]|nr:dockerin type I domain-containing protein [Candidatus Paceibacterota bacterium]
MINIKKILYCFLILLTIFFVKNFVHASTVDGTISPSPKYAFGEKLGWINFGCDNCNVHITDTTLTGYAWSKTHGWINLSPTNGGVTNNCLGQLGGKAWSKSLGWVDFSGVTINALGKFEGVAGTPGTTAGRVSFNCDNCDVSTDWLQCSLRESPAQVVINRISDQTVPSISADITISNEGLIDTEYQYEWCVVSDITNACGGGDDVYYASGAKLIVSGADWNTTKTATVPNIGNYYFKLVVHYGSNYSTASQLFTASNEGSSSGGGGGGTIPIKVTSVYDIADLNKDTKVDTIDFSIMLYYWKKTGPFLNPLVDINKDNVVNSVDFSILLSRWGNNSI